VGEETLFQLIGAFTMLVGIALFIKDRREGTNTLRVAGAEVSLSTPSLVVFVCGAILFVFPFTSFFQSRVSEKQVVDSRDLESPAADQEPIVSSQSSPAEDLQSRSDSDATRITQPPASSPSPRRDPDNVARASRDGRDAVQVDTVPEPAAERAVPINITGHWSDEVGNSYSFTQTDQSFALSGNNGEFGGTWRGSGHVEGTSINWTDRTSYGDTNVCAGQISANGRAMSLSCRGTGSNSSLRLRRL
jgi:hypothetical protein